VKSPSHVRTRGSDRQLGLASLLTAHPSRLVQDDQEFDVRLLGPISSHATSSFEKGRIRNIINAIFFLIKLR